MKKGNGGTIPYFPALKFYFRESSSVPVSKKRKKKTRIKPSRPPISKSAVAGKKKKLTKQQILIYVFSALIILSLAISFIVSGTGGSRAPSTQSNTQVTAPAVETENENAPLPENQDAEQEGSVDATPESDTQN